jgi:ElaB/YqjD/DUF883 family membrane-anchored ribosome-binding protein
MDENQNPEEGPKSGTAGLGAAADDLKEAASANIEHLRQAAGEKADELGQTAQGKGQELRRAAESLMSETRLQATHQRRGLCSCQPEQVRLDGIYNRVTIGSSNS